MPRKYLLTSILFLLTACWFSVGYHQGDEHFQVLEFMAYKLGTTPEAALPWEFDEQMRPAFQPFLAYCFHRLFGLFGPVDPYLFAWFTRLLSAAGFLGVSALIYRRYTVFFRPKWARWLALLLVFNWCGVYVGIRFSSENWGGIFLALGFLTLPLGRPVWARRAGAEQSTKSSGGRCLVPGRYFLGGLLLGTSFLFRYQMAIAIVALVAWLVLIHRVRWDNLLLLLLGGLIMLGLGSLTDRWLYGTWVFAPWNYLAQNLIEGKAATFGTLPWYGYFTQGFLRGIPPLSLVYFIACGWFAYRYPRSPITWMVVTFFVVHSLISRKDIRFLFPLLYFLPLFITVGLRDLTIWKGKTFWQKRWVILTKWLLIGLNLVLLVLLCLRPVEKRINASRFVYRNYQLPVTLLANPEGRHLYRHSDLRETFYQPPGLQVIKTDRSAWPAIKNGTFLYSEYTRDPAPPRGAKLVYSNRPDWLDGLGLKSLIDGQRWWFVYELYPPE